MKSISKKTIFPYIIFIVVYLFTQPLRGETLNYIVHPPSYTKLDKKGNDLPDTATKWSMVRDNIQGLIWEVKTNDGSIHDRDNTYTWYNSHSDTKEENTDNSGNATNTKEFIQFLNKTHFGGYSDWRIPHYDEFNSIINSCSNLLCLTLDRFYFPDTLTSIYWSYKSSNSEETTKVFLGELTQHPDINAKNHSARAVRGGQPQLLDHLTILAPEPTDRWHVGTNKSIAWDPQGITGNVKILLSRQGGKEETYEIIAENTPNDGSYEWKVNGPESFNCFLTIEPINDPSKANTLGVFSILSFTKNWIHTEYLYPDTYHVSLYEQYTDGSILPIEVEWQCREPTVSIDNNTFTSQQNGWFEIFTTYNEKQYQKRYFHYITLDLMEMEPNNTRENASLMTNMRLHQGGFYENDLDYYQFHLSSNSLIDIGYYSFSSISDMKLEIYDSEDTLMATRTSENGYAIFFSLGLNAGNYYMKFSSIGDIDHNNDYVVSYNIVTTLPERNRISLNFGDSTQETIHSLADESTFSFTMTEKQAVQIKFKPTQNFIRYHIEVLDKNNNVINQVECLDSLPVSIEATYALGNYTIKIIATENVDSNVDFIIELNELSTYVEEEPNNINDQASDITMGQVAYGRLSHYSDSDYFKFHLEEFQHAELVFFCPKSYQKFNLALFKDSDEHLIESITSEAQEISFFIGSGEGDYYLKVAAENEDADTINAYILKLKSSTYCVENEPNNLLRHALDIHFDAPIKGRMSKDTDIDYYTFQLDNPCYLHLDFYSPDTAIDNNISLYKESEDNLIESLYGHSAIIDAGLSVGKYYLKISGPVSPYYYTIHIEKSSQTNLEIESNNTLKYANAIKNNSPKIGRIYASSDIDYYGFHLNDTSIFSVHFTPSTTTGDYKVTVVDDNDQLFAIRTSENGTSYTFSASKPAGNYYIKVENNGDVDPYSPYALNISSDSVIEGLKQLVNLTVNGSHMEILPGDSQNLTLTASFSDTSTLILKSTIWESLNEQVASVDSYGKVLGVSEGKTTIVTTYGGLTGKFDIIVGAPTHIVNQHHGNLIIVAGGGMESTNTLKDSTQYLSDLVYGRFKGRLFSDEDIYYFNPMTWHDIDGDGYDDNIVDDETPTVDDFGNAVTNWAGSQSTDGPLYIYLIDHGGIDKFEIFPGQILTASNLKTYLNEFQDNTEREVVIIIEACKSGSFTDDIITNNHARSIITSTDNSNAYLDLKGHISFTQFFVDSLYSGNTLNFAFLRATNELQKRMPYKMMAPQLKEATSFLANKLRIGGNFTIAVPYPTITETSPDQTVNANETHTFFAQLSDLENIEKVWAVVIPPGYSPPEVSKDFEAPEVTLPTFTLTDPDRDGRFEGSYNDFIHNDIYRITFYARNSNDNVAVSPTIEITVQGGSSLDTDGDGIPNDWENKFTDLDKDINDATHDLDNDGLTNLQEYLHNTNPVQNDTDNDGMIDGWEITWGFNPVENDGEFDADNDGVNNVTEYQDQTNPVNSSSFLDHILPWIVSVSPVMGEVNMSQDCEIKIEFNEPMHTASINASNIAINGSSSNAHAVILSYDAMNHTLIITSEKLYEFDETISVTLKSSISDINSNPLDGNKNGIIDPNSADDYTWSFDIAKSPEILPPNPFDSNTDWMISNYELLDAIDAWAEGHITDIIKQGCDSDFYLLKLIDLWMADSYVYFSDDGELCFSWKAVDSKKNKEFY